MKKLMPKIIFILLITALFIFIFHNKALAFDELTGFIKDPGTEVPEPKLLELANPILTLIQIVSAGVATGLIIFDGIKLLTTTDNSEKANLKRKLMYYVIGGVLIFAPATLLKLLSDSSSMVI